MEYVLMIGVALSGKTSYGKANFGHVTIQLSDFNNNRTRELKYIEKCLKEGKSVIIDDTNLTKKIRKIHIDLAKKYNAKVIGIFMNTSIGLIKQRRVRRNDQLPMAVIHKHQNELEIPTEDEGFDELILQES